MQINKDGLFLIRLALAFAFLYVAYFSYAQPENWIGFFPPFLLGLFPEVFLITGHAVFHGVLGLWLLSGWKTFIPSILAFLSLSAIAALNFSQMDIVFRDVSLALAALYLATLKWKTG